MRQYAYLFLLFTTALVSCKKDNQTTDVALDDDLTATLELAADGQGVDFFRMPQSTDFASIPSDPKNPLNNEKVALGQLLYHETGLAIHPKNPVAKNTYSCASCHFASAGFQAGRFQGIADGGIGFGINGEGRERGSLYHGDSLDVQPVRSPTTLHVAYQKLMLWNGQFGAADSNLDYTNSWTEGTPKATNHLGYEGTETQAIAGLTVHRMGLDTAFLNESGYTAMFDAAFPDVPKADRYTNEFAGLAIAAYERTLMANEAPFQRWLNGDRNAMTDAQKEGAILFFGKADCASCHTGPALNKMDFSALGMRDLLQAGHNSFQTSEMGGDRLGRGGFTGLQADNYKFKVPQLYNLKDSPFYGHGSSFFSIKEVVDYKNRAIKENPDVPDEYLSSEFQPLNLTDTEINLITEFIENGLYDNNLNRYLPERILSGFCFPFNDPMARSQTGCN